MLELDYKKTGHWRIDAFELWYWRRLLRVPLTARRSNQSILMKSVLSIQWKDWCWSWSSNILATWCKERTSWKRPWCWERLKAEGEWDNRGWDGWMASPSQWAWVWASSGSWWWTGRPGVLQSMGSQRVRHDSNWTELSWGGNKGPWLHLMTKLLFCLTWVFSFFFFIFYFFFNFTILYWFCHISTWIRHRYTHVLAWVFSFLYFLTFSIDKRQTEDV